MLKLEVVTPNRMLFSGEVDNVTIPGKEGYLGILPGHAPLLTELDVGVVSLTQSGAEQVFFCAWGFAEILGERVTILAEVAELPDEIDVDLARQQQTQALNSLRSRDPETDYEDAVRMLRAADARLKAAAS